MAQILKYEDLPEALPRGALRASGAQSVVLSALLGPWGPQLWYCLPFSGPGGPKFSTIGALGALEAQSVILPALFEPWGPNV